LIAPIKPLGNAFTHPVGVPVVFGGLLPGVFASLDPRLISMTPTGVEVRPWPHGAQDVTGAPPHGPDKFSNLSHEAGPLCLPRGTGFPTCLRCEPNQKPPSTGKKTSVREVPPHDTDKFSNLSHVAVDLSVRPAGCSRPDTVARGHERRGGEGESPYEPPLGVHPQDGVAWVQNTPRGSPDLCVRPLGIHRPDNVAWGHERRGAEGNRLSVARVDSNPHYGPRVELVPREKYLRCLIVVG
jgi:hypothetical protein